MMPEQSILRHIVAMGGGGWSCPTLYWRAEGYATA